MVPLYDVMVSLLALIRYVTSLHQKGIATCIYSFSFYRLLELDCSFIS